MTKITVYEDEQKNLLKDFEEEQWPVADKEHFGEEMPDFTKVKFTILAEEDTQIVGFIKMETDMGVATIDSLLVNNDFQRKGVGSDLMQSAEKKAVEKGCHVIMLETGENWKAKDFYEKQGFSVIAKLNKYYGKRDFVLMEKRI